MVARTDSHQGVADDVRAALHHLQADGRVDRGAVAQALTRALADVERLDWLDALRARVEPQRPNDERLWHEHTDIHAKHGRWTIYVRTGPYTVSNGQGGDTLREAIDITRSKVEPTLLDIPAFLRKGGD